MRKKQIRAFRVMEQKFLMVLKGVFSYRNETKVCPFCQFEKIECYANDANPKQEVVVLSCFCQKCASTWDVLFCPEPSLVVNLMEGEALSYVDQAI